MTGGIDQAPFNLSASDQSWVRSVRDAMTLDDKLRHLFVLMFRGDDPAEARRLMSFRPGGIHRFAGPVLEPAWNATRRALEIAQIPLLVSADLEGGGHATSYGTALPGQLGFAAADDVELSAEAVRVLAREARAMGVNWSFTPVIDISANPASAVVGTRSYGSDLDCIEAQALAHVAAMQAEGVAATAKHWPGEGYDGRDQHLVTTINPLEFEQWDLSFGRLYRSLVHAGVLTVMSAHVALPAWARWQGVSGLAEHEPASVSSLLNVNLLRDVIGFNGLVVSDATVMAGLGSWGSRAELVPQVIASGCDAFLFSPDADGDLEFMHEGVRQGRLSQERVDEAVTRVLALKAALGLHRQQLRERLPSLESARQVVRSEAHQATADALAAKSITLVKDVSGLLPLDPVRHRRVVVIEEAPRSVVTGQPEHLLGHVSSDLVARGFEVRSFDPDHLPTADDTDLVVYLMARESMLVASRVFVNWRELHAGFEASMRRFWHELPTIMVSFGHPYHLYDAPRMPAYVNAYSTVESVQHAVVRKLLGDEPFTGHSPVDAFCGLGDARF